MKQQTIQTENVLTLKERYFTLKEAIETAYLVRIGHNITTYIKVTGKNKACIKLGKIQNLEKYKELKKDLETIGVYIYKPTQKHKNRIYKMNQNENRIKEEAESNLELIQRIKEYKETHQEAEATN